MKSFWLYVLLFCVIGSAESFAAQAIFEAWSLSPLSRALRHPQEGARVENKSLIVRSRYEDHSVLVKQEATRELTCRFLHSFLYGRHRLRSSSPALLPQRAFDRFSQVESIEFEFFTSLLSNEPTSPYWDIRPSLPPEAVRPDSSLRVEWTRQEEVISYLQLRISRQEWTSLASLLDRRPHYAFREFEQEACDAVFQFLPQLKSNFTAIRNALLQKN
ncbi:MAG: hypothetical protein EA369_09380 [Bradymonadales bacterium]|nr:MAG: hypothetical protein EA369_09380 [Bradymonadales bacterium]